MCGRFAQAESPHEISERFGAREAEELAAYFDEAGGRYNIAPTQPVLAVIVAEDGGRELTPLQWGLVPSWAEDSKGGAKCCNARAETVAEKPSFRAAFRQRRCLIPASAFYEWRRATDRQPFAIRSADGAPLAFAGLWEVWRKGDQPLYTCTILTTEANAAMEPVHHRMPVILTTEGVTTWLTPTAPAGALQELLQPCASGLLRVYPVGKEVGKVQNQGSELLEPVSLDAPPPGTGMLTLDL
jgi:putative SOS response-associated peptidase YedK